MPASPEMYMTPQLAKRKDGLCPLLLNDGLIQKPNAREGPSHAAMAKSYQTNTKYLTESIRELENDAEELKFISDSIDNFLKNFTARSGEIDSVEFEPKGCTWKLEMNQKVHAPDYRIQVTCFAKEAGIKRTTFVIDTTLVGKNTKSLASTSLPGFKEARATFETIAIVVRKAVVKCEFPDFPEGCKGRIFREVYQLNARVCG
jgi:hypothetical protein